MFSRNGKKLSCKCNLSPVMYDNEAAKEASIAPELTDRLPVRMEDLKCQIRNDTWDRWQDQWSVTRSKLGLIKRSVRPWSSEFDLSRKDQVVMTRLRLGHTRMTHCHLLLRRPPPRCSCGEDFTILHVLTDCTAYQPARQALDLPPDLTRILAPSSPHRERVLEFFKNSGLFYDL